MAADPPPLGVAGSSGPRRGALRRGRWWPAVRCGDLLRVLRHVRAGVAGLRGLRVRPGQPSGAALCAALPLREPAPPRRAGTASSPGYRGDDRVRDPAGHRMVLGGRVALVDPQGLATARVPGQPPRPGDRRPARAGRSGVVAGRLARGGVRDHRVGGPAGRLRRRRRGSGTVAARRGRVRAGRWGEHAAVDRRADRTAAALDAAAPGAGTGAAGGRRPGATQDSRPALRAAHRGQPHLPGRRRLGRTAGLPQRRQPARLVRRRVDRHQYRRAGHRPGCGRHAHRGRVRAAFRGPDRLRRSRSPVAVRFAGGSGVGCRC